MDYAYITDANRKGKLSKKAEKLRFIGYSLQTKGYRLIDENTSKVVIRRDVIFNESDFNHNSDVIEVGECREDEEMPVIPEDGQSGKQASTDQEEDQRIRYPRRQRIVPMRYGID